MMNASTTNPLTTMYREAQLAFTCCLSIYRSGRSRQRRLIAVPIFDRSFASGFYGGDFSEISWQFISRKIFHVHFDQTHKRTTKIRFGFAATIDDDAHGGDRSAARADDVDRFLNAAATGNNIFYHDKFFALVDLESATKR